MQKNTIFYILFFILILFFTVVMYNITVQYTTFEIDTDFLLTKQNVIANKVWRYSFYCHIFSSIFLLLAGVVQFSNFLLNKYPRIHRFCGYFYVLVLLLVSGPSGLIMSFYANGGVYAKAGFVILSVLWMLVTFLAYYYASRKQFNLHRNFMYRSYALTLSAISLRLMVYTLPMLLHLRGKEMYILVSWAGWMLNLAIAELLIIFRKTNY